MNLMIILLQLLLVRPKYHCITLHIIRNISIAISRIILGMGAASVTRSYMTYQTFYSNNDQNTDYRSMSRDESRRVEHNNNANDSK